MEEKYCGTCRLTKPVEEFAFKNKSTGTRQSKCKQCQREYTRGHYNANKDDYKSRAKRDRSKEYRKTRDLMNSLKSSGCVVCGEDRLPTLQFHHTNPSEKDHNISLIRTRKKIIEEASKCVVLCANCHFMEHHLLRNGESQLPGVVKLV